MGKEDQQLCLQLAEDSESLMGTSLYFQLGGWQQRAVQEERYHLRPTTAAWPREGACPAPRVLDEPDLSSLFLQCECGGPALLSLEVRGWFHLEVLFQR